LQQLVRYLATRADLAGIAVVRCTLMFASPERDAQMARLLGRYGFELVPGASALTLRNTPAASVKTSKSRWSC